MNRNEYWSLFTSFTEGRTYGYRWTGWYPGTVELHKLMKNHWIVVVTSEAGDVQKSDVGSFQQCKREAIRLVAEHGEA